MPMYMLCILKKGIFVTRVIVVYLSMQGTEQNNRKMLWLFMVLILPYFTQMVKASKEILVERPFYLRARILDVHTANVLFEIADENNQRTCQMYKFTVRRNEERTYSMPEQNLTYWRNSLELKHLAAGKYRVCAIICSEHLRQAKFHYKNYAKKNRTAPIKACVVFNAYRSHLLILTLYILVLIILLFSHIVYSLRKRQFQARMKLALIEIENSVQKWRSNPSTAASNEHIHSTTILQNVVTLPTSPIEHAVLPQPSAQSSNDEHHPIIFHLESTTE